MNKGAKITHRKKMYIDKQEAHRMMAQIDLQEENVKRQRERKCRQKNIKKMSIGRHTSKG